MRLVKPLTRSRRRNRTNVGQRKDSLTARLISGARTARRRYQNGRPVRLRDRRVELVMDSWWR